MTSAVQIRRDTAANVNAATPLSGELAYATDTKDFSIGDGSTLGGNKLAKADQVHAASAKTTLVDADEIGLVDSAASNVVKKITWANVKTAIFSGWGAVIAAATGKTTPVDADVIAISDSEATNATKGLTFANLAAWVGSKLGPQISAQTGKTTPVDADTLVISDSAASNVSKKLTWANAKAALNTYLSGLGSLSIVAGDLLYGSSTAVLSRLAKGSDGQVLTLASGLPAWAAAASGAGTARNRIVNPAMQISSINGNTAGTVTGYSPADNWSKFHVSSAGTLTAQRVQSVTPKGAKDRLRLTVTVADASLASGEYLTISQNIIGQEVADFQYGGASAKQSLLRFLFKGPQGTYAIHLGNSATNRSYVALFTISAGQTNTDTIQTFTIPGDTTGTWLTDTGTGITLDIVLAAGATFQGTTGWQSGLILATSGISNGMGTLSNVFEIGEAGLYLDVAATAAFPTWELPSQKTDIAAIGPLVFGVSNSSTGVTSKDFTAPVGMVPKRVTVVYSLLSGSGTSPIQVQLGDAGGVETSGYLSSSGDYVSAATVVGNFTTGFQLGYDNLATRTFSGVMTLISLDPASATWIASGLSGDSTTGRIFGVGGSKTLSPGPLTTVRVTAVNGSDTFDAGSVNVIWEG